MSFIVCNNVQGKTLNAVFLEHVISGWNPHVGYPFLLITLISEGYCFFVAAQPVFLDGPRVLSNMAVDRWVPAQFSLLSERFTAKNGVLLMGAAALAILIFTGGSVTVLVVLYSINVFITFFLSQLGMTRHWWNERKQEKKWKSKIFINGSGLILTAFILSSVLNNKISCWRMDYYCNYRYSDYNLYVSKTVLL